MVAGDTTMSASGAFSLDLPQDVTAEEAVAIRTEWQRVLHQLVDQIRSWVELEEGWKITDLHQAEIFEYPFGVYSVPILTFKTPEGRVIVEPAARNLGGKGVVEMYVLPTLRRVKMLHNIAGVEWQILTDSGISLRQPWSRETFVQVVSDMLAADL